MTKLIIGFGGDCFDPQWQEADRVHDWRNYISDEMRAIWHDFTPTQKRIIAQNAEDIAGREHWE